LVSSGRDKIKRGVETINIKGRIRKKSKKRFQKKSEAYVKNGQTHEQSAETRTNVLIEVKTENEKVNIGVKRLFQDN